MEFNLQKLKYIIREIDSNQIRNYLLNLHPLLLSVWIIVNLTIPAYGILLYSWQYSYYNPIFWIFIPDSNSFGLLFGVFLIVTLAMKKNIQILNIITFIGLIKVFVGYIVLFTLIPSYFDLVSLTAHTIELIEGLLILPFIKTDLKNFIVAGSILLLDIFLDFFNPFDRYPTLALYQPHEIYNPVGTAPFFWHFFLLFSVVTAGLLIYIRLKHWTEENTSIKWIERLQKDL
ncbi:MAG: DUF1405 domain-containing protein [Candidatus Heimdallarchaeota archaeon]|nr:MAG: DUF1405 domain-containing protein [Candidatus Heimdallarchaeota archaeon]